MPCLILKRKEEKIGIEQPNQERIKTLGERENYEYLRILEAEMKEKVEKSLRRTKNQAPQQKSHHRDKHLGGGESL